MKAPISIHEIRRRAPMHYEAKADNAHYVAYLLNQTVSPALRAKTANGIRYGGNPNIALYEAFMRESCLALELIIKAVIAQKVEIGIAAEHVVRVRTTHDLPSLWIDAGLPMLSNDDRLRLLRARRVLVWSGKYAAPKTDEEFEKEELKESILIPAPSKTTMFRKTLSFGWEDFDRLYRVAWQEFWLLRRNYFSV